jgi:hypothetical protein
MSKEVRRRISLALKRRWAERKRGRGKTTGDVQDLSRLASAELAALRNRIDRVLVERMVRGNA